MDSNWLKVKGLGNICHGNSSQKEDTVVILISHKANLRIRKIIMET